jgi:hypothetical protein
MKEYNALLGYTIFIMGFHKIQTPVIEFDFNYCNFKKFTQPN